MPPVHSIAKHHFNILTLNMNNTKHTLEFFHKKNKIIPKFELHGSRVSLKYQLLSLTGATKLE